MKRRKKRSRHARQQQLEQQGNRMNGRLASHFLKRLRRKATALALADAVAAGILRQEDVASHGRLVSVYRRNLEAGGAMSPTKAVAMLSRHRRRLSNESPQPIGSEDFTFGPDIEPGEAMAARCPNAVLRGTPCTDQERANDLAMVRAVRAAAEPPRASDVATMLLIAQAVPDNEAALRDLLRSLRLRRPIVTVISETRGFERNFLELLKRGLILSGAVERSNGYESRYETFRFEHVAAARRRVITFAGSDRNEEDGERQFGSAASSAYPIIAVSEKKELIAPKLTQASQLYLGCGTLTAEIVRLTVEAVLGDPPSSGRLDGIDFGRLGLSDLAMAIRPGVTADMAADGLRRLADAAGDDPDDGTNRLCRKGKPRSSELSRPHQGTDPGSGSDVIAPKPPSEIGEAQSRPTVENLAGYGEAKTWAIQIRDELPLWREGKLAWTDMSTKVLLSGPPGIGKSLFARALCNTLQIPLLATSVARWLEPSHLGDVLRRMRRAFAEAEAQAPCILFVDEFDGIGRRVPFETREFADYWNSVVNCGLEMLDGAARTDGVIVVCATNDPSALDPALLRSGRLERQIEIPLPDVEARLAILQHHLGADLDGVLANAAKTAGKADLNRMLQEGMEMMSDRPYRDLVAAAIPSHLEIDVA